MKAALFLVPIVAICGAIGWHQRVELNRLDREERALREVGGKPRDIVVSLPPEVTSHSETVAEIRSLVERRLLMREGSGLSDAESAALEEVDRRTHERISELSHEEALRLIEELGGAPDAAPEPWQKVCRILAAAYRVRDPAEGLGLLERLPEMTHHAEQVRSMFRGCVTVDPAAAIRWYDGEGAVGKIAAPIADDPIVLEGLIVAQSRVDPVRALARMAATPGILKTRHAGTAIGKELRNLAEHRAFLQAHREVAPVVRRSEPVIKIRNEYLRELIEWHLPGWPSREAISLVRAELGPDEALRCSRMIGERLQWVEEPASWATWLSGIEAPPEKGHPFKFPFIMWHGADPVSARQWLDTALPCEAKTIATGICAYGMASTDPAAAMELALNMPEGEERTQTLIAIRRTWKEKDPAAAAAFADKHGLVK